MKILSIQEAYKKKFERQRAINGLQYHAAGHCVHIGKLSPGCYSCFIPDSARKNISAGNRCNLSCPYCPGKRKGKKPKNWIWDSKIAILRESAMPDYNPSAISFTGGGEPLLHMDVIADFMGFFHDLEKYMKRKPWYYLYTNGTLANPSLLLRLKDMGFDEIRFHLGASNFSKKVYQNLKKAVSCFKAVTVETPAWPPHRKKLFEMLPIIEDMGVKHLNLGEIEITTCNYDKIAGILPDGEIYQCFEMHLYDGGLVYDIIEEVLKKKYSYSVLDCGCFVKSIQRSPAKSVDHEDITGLIASY